MSTCWRGKLIWRGAVALMSAILAVCWAFSGAQAQTSNVISYGETVTGEVADRLGEEWLFSGCIDDVITITMTSPDFGAFLELYGPTGRDSLAAAAAEGPGATATIQDFALSTSGDHVIVAAGGAILDRGAYTLTLQSGAVAGDANQEAAGHLTDGTPVQGAVDNRLGQEWTFHGCANDIVAITMESPDFTPLLAVIGPDNTGITEAIGDENSATIDNLSLPVNGAYTVIAAGASILDRGAYTLTFTLTDTLTEQPAPAGDVSSSDVVDAPDESSSAEATPVPPSSSSSSVETKGGDVQQPLCIVIAEMVNLYTGPDTAYVLLGGLEQGAEVIPRNRNADQTWVRIQVAGEGVTGWVQATPETISCNVDVSNLPLGIIPPLYTPTPVPYPTDCYTPTPTPTEVYYTPTYTPTPTEVYYTPTYTPTPTEVYYTPTYTPTPTEVYYTPTYTPTPTEVYYTPTYTPTPTEVYYTPTYTPTPTEVYYTPTPTATEPYDDYEPVGHQVYPPNVHYGDLEGAIYVPENYGQDHEPVFYNYLYIEAYVYDPYVGTYNGAGIDYFDFRIYNDNGDQVYYKQEVTARYCLFGGGEPYCPALVIEPGAYWPGTNTPLTEGRYYARIDAYPEYNNSDAAYWEFYFWIQPQYDGGNGGGNGNGNGNAYELYGEVVQTGHGHNNDSVTDRLVFQVVAYDPAEGNDDGAGIDYVILQIYYNNDKVYERQENNAGYCAFSGGEPDCNYWDFSDNDYQWPDGAPISGGQHLLRAIIYASSGEQMTIERQINISD